MMRLYPILLIALWSRSVVGWYVVFKVGGQGVDTYNSLIALWSANDVLNDDQAAIVQDTYRIKDMPSYKSDIVRSQWNKVKMTKIGMYKDGQESAYVIFNATNTDMTSWFDANKVLQSSYPDLVTPKARCSLHNNATDRSFQVISTSEGADCSSFGGWMMAVDDGGSSSCHWEYGHHKPFFLYSTRNSAANFIDGSEVSDSFVVFVVLVDGRTIVRRDAPLKKHLKEHKTLETSLEPHSRQRRGWGSVIFYGTSILIRTTNVGLTLAAIVSDGCVYYQSICDDRDAIEQLDKDIEALKTEYDTEYVKSATDWVNLRDANNNNGYVNYYIDEALQAVQTLDDLQLLLTDKLELKLPNLFARYQANQNLSAEDYLNILVGQLETSLDATKEMLENQKKGEMIGLLVQMLVETTLDRFVTGYKKAYNDLRLYDKMESHYNALWTAVFEADPAEARILSDPTHPDYENALKRNGLKSSEITSFERVKMAPKVFVEMFGNSKKYLADSYNSLKEWGQVESWDGFKAKALSTLETPINKMKAVKNFIFDSNSRKYTVENFKMDWSTRIMTGLGAIVDIVTQAVSVAEWSKVRDEMANARSQYEEYKSALQTEINNIKEEQANQTIEWGNIVDTFKELSSAFDGLIQNASSYADFADVMGLPRLPVDSSNPMFSVDVNTLDQTNLIPAQEAYVEFLKENNNNLTVVNDEMSARNTLYTSVVDKTDQNEVVSEIHTDLGEIYSFNPSATIKQFGTDLTKKDVVCTAAVLRVDMDEYDHYDLTAFRPSCYVDQSAFTTMEAEAEAARNKVMMDTIVYTEVSGGSSATLSELLSTVQTAYSVTGDADKMAFGAALSEQDIACSIATQFADKDMYDYIDLTAFRPSCDAVTAQDFAIMQQNAASLRQLDVNVENSMNICDSFSFCPCVSVLASQYGATEAEVQASIKRVRPNLTQYCSTTGCSCVTL